MELRGLEPKRRNAKKARKINILGVSESYKSHIFYNVLSTFFNPLEKCMTRNMTFFFSESFLFKIVCKILKT